MKLSVIISTYNSEEWLEKVIWGYSIQTEIEFEIIIADDGSTDKTKVVLDSLRKELSMPLHHVWHEDNGFQKTKILNKAILAASTDYLLFTDGDCIPRADFVAAHLKFRKKGFFLSGGYFKLPMSISKIITKEDILNQNCFKKKWLTKNGLSFSIKNTKLTAKGQTALFLNYVTPTTPSWNGHNASGWKKDIIAVNGFNQEMQYGGEDRELGERLFNYGIQSIQIRYSAICIHLDHARGYVNQEAIDKNNIIRAKTREEKITFTPNGIIANQSM